MNAVEQRLKVQILGAFIVGAFAQGGEHIPSPSGVTTDLNELGGNQALPVTLSSAAAS